MFGAGTGATAGEAEAAHMPPEGATDMMVLAVYIVRHGASERRVLGAWRDVQFGADVELVFDEGLVGVGPVLFGEVGQYVVRPVV